MQTPKPNEGTHMSVAVSGVSGLVGRALSQELTRAGHRVVPIVRRKPAAGNTAIYWNQVEGTLDADALRNTDAVVHLAGENVVGRWTQAKRDRIRSSRVDSTRLIAQTLSNMKEGPRVFVCASAIGYYGDRSDEKLTEASPPGSAGDGFLRSVSEAWEAAATPAEDAGLRVSYARIGMVLAREGGAIKKMLPAFKLGVGGDLGGGRQWVSWIHLEDLVAMLIFASKKRVLLRPANDHSGNHMGNMHKIVPVV